MRGRPLLFVCLLILALRLVGLFFFYSGESDVNEGIPDGEIILKGTICRMEETDKTNILYLKDNSIFQGKDSFPTSNCIVYDSEKREYKIGNIIQVEGQTKPFESAPNPGNFDQKMYYQKDGILFCCFGEKISLVRGKVRKVAQFFYEFRREWSRMLVRELGEEQGGTLSAMLLGQKGAMDTEEKEQYQKAGIGHLLAVSGLHVSFVGMTFYEFLRRLGVRFSLAGITGIALLFLYGMLTGFGVSVTRAVIMLAFRIGAGISGREYDFPTAIGCAAAWTAWTKPLYLLDAGFLLSYIAVLTIYIGNIVQKVYFSHRGALFQNLWMGAVVQIVLFPVSLYYYFEFPTYSILLNLVVIPGASVIIGNGMLFSIVCMATGNGIGLGISGWMLKWYSRISEASLGLPFSRIIFGRPKWYEILFYYGALLLLYQAMKLSRRKAVMAAFLCVMAAMGLKRNPYPAETVTVTMINVGQGDCFLIQSPDKVCYLVDGGSSDVDEVGKYRIEPFLKYLGIGKVESVFLSHGDEDHVNGILEMLERRQVGVAIDSVVVHGKALKDEDMNKVLVQAGKYGATIKKISCGESIGKTMNLACIWPKEEFEGKDGNENSMVLRLTYGSMSILLTGDMGKESEQAMLKEELTESVTILKVAHHGSKNSSTQEFLQALKPSVALISAGVDNRYGHPSEETLERMQKEGILFYVTSRQGCVGVRLKKDRYHLYSYRKKGQPFPF